MGLPPEEIFNVLKVVASVLKLGNISFIPTNNIDGTEGCTISNDYGKYLNVFFIIYLPSTGTILIYITHLYTKLNTNQAQNMTPKF